MPEGGLDDAAAGAQQAASLGVEDHLPRHADLRGAGGVASFTCVWLGGHVLAPARARGFFEKPAVCRTTDRITGVVLIGFGVKVAASQP